VCACVCVCARARMNVSVGVGVQMEGLINKRETALSHARAEVSSRNSLRPSRSEARPSANT